ncbi:WAP four-disulfide core domain protein [Trichinella spiralis]|uniref:WAP four-disulfide core domain protein n=1 Tax=Trichinella spiralis TaxID=6334 RepID=A0ABR3K788_TRISP
MIFSISFGFLTFLSLVANGKFDKAGLCPLPPGPTVSNAINYCNRDDDCKDAMKCCPTILGRRCMNPDSKRIICPDGSKAQQTCDADSDCHNNLKCINGICCPEKKDSNDDSKSGSCPQLIVPSGYAIGKDDECRAKETMLKDFDEDGIRTHAGKPQWISSPSP